MLSRSLFEDMVVAHWFVMHENHSLLVQRFFDYQDAALVREHDYVTRDMKLPFPSRPRLAEALEQRERFRQDFGAHAERAWWMARADGSRITLAAVIGELEKHAP